MGYDLTASPMVLASVTFRRTNKRLIHKIIMRRRSWLADANPKMILGVGSFTLGIED